MTNKTTLIRTSSFNQALFVTNPNKEQVLSELNIHQIANLARDVSTEQNKQTIYTYVNNNMFKEESLAFNGKLFSGANRLTLFEDSGDLSEEKITHTMSPNDIKNIAEIFKNDCDANYITSLEIKS